jgi:hypothetical protein
MVKYLVNNILLDAEMRCRLYHLTRARFKETLRFLFNAYMGRHFHDGIIYQKQRNKQTLNQVVTSNLIEYTSVLP